MLSGWKHKLNEVIFGTETRAGQLFDFFLLWVIVASVVVVVLESIPSLNKRFGDIFIYLEILFTALFTIEYILRVVITRKPFKYIFSFWGVIDFLAVIPFYLGLLAQGYQYFLVLRLVRLLRVFRILKLFRFTRESQRLYSAMKASSYKIGVFLTSVFTIVILMGTLMYVVEGPENGFTSIPQSVYWTIVTITTVGYGDITPQTMIGKIVASVIMLSGYAIIAVPTGIVTVEMSKQKDHITCKNCGRLNPSEAKYCNSCGVKFEESDR